MADRVGFIGLGTMGMPMAANLAKGGVPLVVYDASPAALAAAAKLPGAIAAGVASRTWRRRRRSSSPACPTTRSCARSTWGRAASRRRARRA